MPKVSFLTLQLSTNLRQNSWKTATASDELGSSNRYQVRKDRSRCIFDNVRNEGEHVLREIQRDASYSAEELAEALEEILQNWRIKLTFLIMGLMSIALICCYFRRFGIFCLRICTARERKEPDRVRKSGDSTLSQMLKMKYSKANPEKPEDGTQKDRIELSPL